MVGANAASMRCPEGMSSSSSEQAPPRLFLSVIDWAVNLTPDYGPAGADVGYHDFLVRSTSNFRRTGRPRLTVKIDPKPSLDIPHRMHLPWQPEDAHVGYHRQLVGPIGT